MTDDNLPLYGRVALVTGASRGIGCEIARELARQGAHVALSARSSQNVEPVAEEIRSSYPGREALPLACDVASQDAVDEAVDRTVGEWDRLDVLVNNAGITRDNLLLRMKEEDWDAVMATNLKGTFHACRAAARRMVKQRFGRIVNIASVVGLIGNAGQANYSASKGGVVALTFSLARELASRGVTVNAVAPGFIDTDMTAGMTEEARSAVQEKIPLGRIGDAEDVATAVAFLCGPGAAYITGEVIRVDGGLAMG